MVMKMKTENERLFHFSEFYGKLVFVLRYYATYKMRKFESLYKINTFLQKLPLNIGLPAGQNVIYKYINYKFVQFWASLLRFLFFVISKSSASCGKNTEIIFATLYLCKCAFNSRKCVR